MLKFIKKISQKAGSALGTLVHIGERKTDKPRITVLDYDDVQLHEKQLEHIEEAFPFKDSPTTTWLNIDGIHDVEMIEKIGAHFNIHPLILEDIVNTGQRPKVDDFETYNYFILKMLYLDEQSNEVRSEQVSLVLGNNFLISFQEIEGDVFALVRDRIRKGKRRIRKNGATTWPMP